MKNIKKNPIKTNVVTDEGNDRNETMKPDTEQTMKLE